MLGRQPVEAMEHRGVAMIYVASHGVMRLGNTAFEDIRSEMKNEVALDRLVVRVKARFKDLFVASTQAECRKLLVDLADQHIKRLNSKAARLLKKAEAKAEQTVDKLTVDRSPKGASAKELELKCLNTIKRLMAPYQTEQRDKPKGGGRRVAGCPDEGRKAREAWRGEAEETCGRGHGGVGDPRRTEGGDGGGGEETYGRGHGGVRDPRRTEGGRGDGEVGDLRRTEGGGCGEASGDREPRQARADEWERVESELDESDIRACGGFLPVGRTGLASATLGTDDGTGLCSGTLSETEASTGLASATLVHESDDAAGAVLESAGDAGIGGISPATGETASGESVTNEPELDEDVKSSNYITNIGFTTNSGVDSGLDNGGIERNFDGSEIVNGTAECGETLRTRRPPTAACGGTSPTSGAEVGFEGGRSNTGTADCGEASLIADPSAACGGTSSPSEEDEDEAELRELQAQLAIETVKRQARAGPMAEAIRDLMASSPEAMELLKEFLPGYRPVSVVSGQLSVAEDLGVHREPLPRAP